MDPPKLYNAVENLFDSLAAEPSPTQCHKCGSELMYPGNDVLVSGREDMDPAIAGLPKVRSEDRYGAVRSSCQLLGLPA